MITPIRKYIAEEIRDRWRASTYVAYRPPVTVAILTVRYNHCDYTGIGIARCMPTDTWDIEVGRQVAQVRAERQVLRDIIKEEGKT
jgi:hypothetical protein